MLTGFFPAAVPSARAQGAQVDTHMEVTKITPSVVAPGSPGELTISGVLTNTGTRPIAHFRARLEHGAPASSEAYVHDALQQDAPTTAQTTFTPVAGALGPGQRTPFELRVPLAGGPNSLQITSPGVYPVMLNVNGQSAEGRSRVAEARFLLPVLSTPGGPPPARPPQETPATMLVPIVDFPRMEREATPGQRAILVDDRLSRDLAPHGRLSDLVQAVDDSVGPGSPLGSSLCFAIDPDLLATANSMKDGYLIREPDGGLRDGIGAGAAQLWLRKLQAVTKGRCVIALPYGDADVVALGRAGLPDLIKGALDGSAVVQRTLDVEPRRDVLWPIDGALDEPAVSELSGMGVKTLLMDPEAMSPGDATSPMGLRGQQPSTAPTIHPIDRLLSQALDPTRAATNRSTNLSPPPTPPNGALSGQNTVGALAYRATLGYRPGAREILAPPRRWNLDGDELRGMLRGIQQLSEAGLIKPTGLPTSGTSSAQPPSAGTTQPPPDQLPAADLAYPVTSATSEIHQQVLDDVAKRNYKVGDLYRSSEADPATNVEPAALTTPLRNGLLRAASSAWRGNVGASRYWLQKAGSTLDETLSRVQVDDFGGEVNLGSPTAPIPLTVTNRLPVTTRVELEVSGPPGVKTKQLGVLKIPALGSRQFWLDTEVHRVGTFSVDVTMWTEGKTQLGSTRRLQLESNAYDPFTLVFTYGAGGLLLLLFARRVIRKVKANRAAKTATGEESASPESPQSGVPATPQTATAEGDREPS
jgi:hypothetical protein